MAQFDYFVFICLGSQGIQTQQKQKTHHLNDLVVTGITEVRSRMSASVDYAQLIKHLYNKQKQS